MRTIWVIINLIIWTVILAGGGLILSIFEWKGRILGQVAHIWSKIILTVAGVKYSVKGLDNLDPKDELEEEQIKTYKLSNKSPMKKRQHSRKYNRQNKVEIKKRRVKLSRSLEGRKRKKLKKPMGKRGLTPVGREKVRYHPTMGGQGGERKKEKK